MERNRKKTTSGNALTVFNESRRCYDGENNYKVKFKQCLSLSKQDAIDYADEFELFYFQKFYNKVKSLSDFGWSKLSRQEKTVIAGIDAFQLIAYLGYRESFLDGTNRRGCDHKPVFALLELASPCNIKCPFCFQSDKSFTTKEFMGYMDFEMAKNVVDQIDSMKIRGLTLASRGEPLLYKHFEEFLEYLNTKTNILEVKLNTNAKLLNEEKLNSILSSKVNILVVSTDHYEKEKYEILRKGANFDHMINNISKINSLRDQHGKNNLLLTRASGVKFTEDLNVNQFSEFYHQYFDEVALINYSERWNTYSNNVDPNDHRSCGLPFERLYIWHDGTTNPCDSDYKSYLSPGRFGDLSLRQCWDKMGHLRKSMLRGERQMHTPCDRCYDA